jgi:hypothetical protein
MPLGMPDTPAVLDDLYGVLLAEGFEVVENRRGGIGGLQVTLRGPMDSAGMPQSEVQISADCGHWTVGLRFAGMTRFIDPRVWTAYLDGTPIAEPDVSDQARFVGTRLSDAASVAAINRDIESELVQLGEDYMRRRLGME